jgi:hypothetical protein
VAAARGRGYPGACIASGEFAHRDRRSAVPFALWRRIFPSSRNT